MDTKPLLYGLIGFFIGGLLVSVAATTFDRPDTMEQQANGDMSAMTTSLRSKTGDDFESLFISQMIEHHESAVKMARLSEARAKHPDIKVLSREIISAQGREISLMREWQSEWGYIVTKDSDHNQMSH